MNAVRLLFNAIISDTRRWCRRTCETETYCTASELLTLALGKGKTCF